jgi:hypothetical protein
MSQFDVDHSLGTQALKGMYRAIFHGDPGAYDPNAYDPNKPFGGVPTNLPTTESTLEELVAAAGTFQGDLERVGIDASKMDKGKVKEFLNRLLGMPVARQNLLFDFFMKVLQRRVEQAKKEGKFMGAVADVTGQSIKQVGEEKIVHVSPSTTATTYHRELQVDRGVSFELATTMLHDHRTGSTTVTTTINTTTTTSTTSTASATSTSSSTSSSSSPLSSSQSSSSSPTSSSSSASCEPISTPTSSITNTSTAVDSDNNTEGQDDGVRSDEDEEDTQLPYDDADSLNRKL